jgi:hypothetical protein
MLRAAAQRVYATKKFANRGEFGELLLHIAARQVFNTLPEIKVYYKDADNDTVKGFDSVHAVGWHYDAVRTEDLTAQLRHLLQNLRPPLLISDAVCKMDTTRDTALRIIQRASRYFTLPSSSF